MPAWPLWCSHLQTGVTLVVVVVQYISISPRSISFRYPLALGNSTWMWRWIDGSSESHSLNIVTSFFLHTWLGPFFTGSKPNTTCRSCGATWGATTRATNWWLPGLEVKLANRPLSVLFWGSKGVGLYNYSLCCLVASMCCVSWLFHPEMLSGGFGNCMGHVKCGDGEHLW